MRCLFKLYLFQELLVQISTSTFLVKVLPLLKDTQKVLAAFDNIEQEIDTIKKKVLKRIKR